MKRILLASLLLLLSSAAAKAQNNTLSIQCGSQAAVGANAQYTVKVDGVTNGGTVTCGAAIGSGTWQTNTVTGNWPTIAVHQVQITFTNDYYAPPADRNLYIKSVSLDGVAATGTSVPLGSTNGYCGWNSTGSYWSMNTPCTLSWSTIAAAPIPPALASINVSPTSLVGGAVADGWVALTSNAPTGNVVVALSNSSPQVTIPNTVTVGAGSSNAHFGVNTTAPTGTTAVVATLAATYSGVTKTITLAVNPPPPPVAPAMTVVGATVTLAAIPAPPVTTRQVSLTWQQGTPPPSGFAISSFNVYRGAATGGPYTKLTNVAMPLLTYTDHTVVAATTYFYVVTAVDSSNQESVYSNEASAVIP